MDFGSQAYKSFERPLGTHIEGEVLRTPVVRHLVIHGVGIARLDSFIELKLVDRIHYCTDLLVADRFLSIATFMC